jgi:predicted restriction endonuclease
MSITEIKATISKMNVRQRRELRQYLTDLETEPKAGTKAWKVEMARRINEMQSGTFYTMDEARAIIARKRS